MTDEELEFILSAIEEVLINAKIWEKDYDYSSKTNEYKHKRSDGSDYPGLQSWFTLPG